MAPVRAAATVGGLFLVISGLSYLRGAAARPSPINVTLCSPAYWALDGAALAILLLFLCASGGAAVSRHRKRHSSSYGAGDVRWDVRGVVRYGGCAAVAGCASSFIGIGGVRA